MMYEVYLVKEKKTETRFIFIAITKKRNNSIRAEAYLSQFNLVVNSSFEIVTKRLPQLFLIYKNSLTNFYYSDKFSLN